MRKLVNKNAYKSSQLLIHRILRERTKSHTSKLFEAISKEITKQTNKAFGKLTEDISNNVLGKQINKSIEDTYKELAELNKTMQDKNH